MKPLNFISPSLLCASSKDSAAAKSGERINSHPSPISSQQKIRKQVSDFFVEQVRRESNPQ